MLTPTVELLQAARQGGYAIGVYNLEGVLAVVAAAEAEHSPAMRQNSGTITSGIDVYLR